MYAVGLICLRLTFAPLWDGDSFTAFLQLLRAGFFFSFRFFWFFFCFFCSKEKEPEEANSGFFFFFAAVWDRKNVFSQLWNVFSFLFFFCRCGTERTCSLTEEGVLLRYGRTGEHDLDAVFTRLISRQIPRVLQVL